MKHSRPLLLEQLEDRTVPVTWGNPWPDAMHLTASFMPDGSQTGQASSDLFEHLNQQVHSKAWQTEILRALQTWAVHGNVNVGLVDDGGQALGAAGRPQGDARFGDVRITGFAMPPDVLAIANPFELTGGTTSGDIRFNTAAQFSINGGPGVDLYTAALHEAAHAFGLDHSADSRSAVFATYQGRSTGLTAEDVARFQALYGARQGDQFEGSRGNESLGSATRLRLIGNGGLTSVSATGDVTTLDDVDVYKFRAPLNVGKLQINLRAEGLSLLTAKVTVLDSRGRAIASAQATDPLSNDLSVTISRARALRTYYVKVEGASEEVFGIGSYKLEIESLPALRSLLGSIKGTASDVADPLLADDLHTDDSIATASLLPIRLNATSSSFDYAFRGSIRDGWDVDFYKIQSPEQLRDTDVLTVMAWGIEQDGLAPKVSVFNAQGSLVASEVLVNADGFFAIQIEDVQADADYFVKVEALSGSDHHVGNYFLGVDFAAQAVELTTIAKGRLDVSASTSSTQLVVERTETRHFVLEAGGDDAATVEVTVYDSAGRAVARFDAESGEEPSSHTVRLEKGEYRIEVALADDALATDFVLKGSRLSDPIGPQPEDPTEDPEDDVESQPENAEPSSEHADASSEQPSSSDDDAVTPASEDDSPPPPTDDDAAEPSSEPAQSSQTEAPDEDDTVAPSSQDDAPPYEEEEDGWYDDYQARDHRGLESEDPYDDPYQPY